MKRHGLSGVFLAWMFILFASGANAQERTPSYRVGDRLEVQYGYQWFEATVTEVLATGAVRATFRDERQYPPVINEIFAVGVMTRPLPGTPQAAPMPAPASSPPRATPPPTTNPPADPSPPAAAPPAISAGPGATKFKVGDPVLAICMGSRQEAFIAGIENGQYRIRWVGGSCGDFRNDSNVFPRPEAAPTRPTGPIPASLTSGTYACFASVPHYTGSTYMPGVGSIPNYRFTWERVGTLILGESTYRSEARGQAAAYNYDRRTGSIRWQGGMHAGVASNFAYTDDGKREIQIHRKDGQRGTWHCQR